MHEAWRLFTLATDRRPTRVRAQLERQEADDGRAVFEHRDPRSVRDRCRPLARTHGERNGLCSSSDHAWSSRQRPSSGSPSSSRSNDRRPHAALLRDSRSVWWRTGPASLTIPAGGPNSGQPRSVPPRNPGRETPPGASAANCSKPAGAPGRARCRPGQPGDGLRPWTHLASTSSWRSHSTRRVRRSHHDDVPIGAVVARLDTGEVIARRHNERELQADPTAHAEVLALRDAAAGARHAGGSTSCALVVTLEPCPMCAGAALGGARRAGRVRRRRSEGRRDRQPLQPRPPIPRLNHEVDGRRRRAGRRVRRRCSATFFAERR